ncbi:procollagen-lysine,2-oxoglutarate 5-dioxygenase 1-like [Bolinopsis microptera]|uniref:procollagen-lysine,2-oxoglutarate 5-dioxygenase 1-like n=1 Tax=Bolinopsis microptera TaxID=2820187 RepID=UPI00307A3B64
MVMSILQIILLVMVKCSLSMKVLHQLPQSEILDIVERSWIENDIPIENTGLDSTDENELVVFILRPTSINVCSKDLLLDHLPKQNNKLYADDAADPNILIGPMEKIRLYHQLGAKKVKTVVDEDFIYLLDEGFAVGMRENNSLYNYKRSTSPCILSAPRDKLNILFRFANYVPRVNAAVTWPDSFNWHGYCHICDDILKSPTKLEKDGLIVIAGFIFQWTPLLYNWLSTLLNQEVKSKIFYIIYNNVTEHEEVIKEFTSSLEGLDGLVLGTSFFKDKDLSDIRGHSAVMCSALECQYLFTVDSEVALLRNNIISHLVQFNKSVITAPVTFGRERSNFWGDITEGGWYRRSPDYFEIIDGAWGLFVVPYIKLMYLTRSDALPDYQGHEKYSDRI